MFKVNNKNTFSVKEKILVKYNNENGKVVSGAIGLIIACI